MEYEAFEEIEDFQHIDDRLVDIGSKKDAGDEKDEGKWECVRVVDGELIAAPMEYLEKLNGWDQSLFHETHPAEGVTCVEGRQTVAASKHLMMVLGEF